VFYVFENTKNSSLDKKKKKKRKHTSSETGQQSSDVSVTKVDYSLREIASLPVEDLNSKIFTFEKKLASDDLTKMNEETKNLDKVIKSLKCKLFLRQDFGAAPCCQTLQDNNSLTKREAPPSSWTSTESWSLSRCSDWMMTDC
jgi:hypothetical protein